MAALVKVSSSSKSAVSAVGVLAGAKKVSGDKALGEALKRPGFRGDAGEVAAAGEKHVLVGLGKKDDLDTDGVRVIGARLVKQLDRMGHSAVDVDGVLDAIEKGGVDGDDAAQAMVEGMVLARWKVDFFEGSAAKKNDNGEKKAKTVTVVAGDSGLRKAMNRGLVLGESVNYARRLGATPPNVCNPKWMVSEARKLARDFGMSIRVIDYKRAVEQGMGGIVNVGKGSASKPCLIMLEHKPAKPKKGAGKIALVGKTITYDTGGYSLKLSGGMKGMKYDKCGGMAVIGAMRAIAALKLPVHVVGLLPTAENMVNGESYRPDDIIEMYNGVTVEVTNTDAEGRLVMADALAYACKTIKPKAIIDAATLTGGVVVGLGHFCAGLWCEDDGLREQIESAAARTGEKVWHMPLWDAHKDFMRSKHADIWNSAPSRNAHPIQGAAFLSYFVNGETPWAHLDIAGMADVDSDKDLWVTGPTGYGVRLLTETVQRLG